MPDPLVACPRCVHLRIPCCSLCAAFPRGMPRPLAVEYVLLGISDQPGHRAAVLVRALLHRHGYRGS